MYFVSQDLSGNGEIITRVTTQTNTNDWAKAGIIIKDSTQSLSGYALLAVTPAHGIVMQYGFNSEVAGPSYIFPNAWLKLKRDGNNIASYSSIDGVSWILIGTRTVTLNQDVKIGLFVTSHNGSNISTVTFDNVSVSTTPIASLPSPWLNTDIGNPTLGGSAGFDSSIFTLNGAGNDIWADADQFQFVYQPLIGDGEISTRITSQTILMIGPRQES